uniref:Rho GDP-dissociation inhibitor 1 n=1 Tax=Astatotilapia calliptera TaxID=8154 RepID=A0AAX7VWF6_ASTCA
MAEHEPTPEELAAIAAANDESDSSVNYKPPAQKSLKEIQELDQDDESLRKYKEALLGNAAAVVVDPTVPNVQVTKMVLVCDTAPNNLVLDLTGDLEGFRKNPFPMKEGVEYRIKICFKVRVWCLSHSPLRSVYVAVLLLQHCWRCNCSLQSTIIIVRGFSEEFNSCCLLQVNKEIVSGLKYMQQTFRKGVKVDKSDYMVGSYGPRPSEEYEFLTTMEEAPKGMLARGTYHIKSKFTDDDKNDHLSWEWSLAIKKDWKD